MLPFKDKRTEGVVWDKVFVLETQICHGRGIVPHS